MTTRSAVVTATFLTLAALPAAALANTLYVATSNIPTDGKIGSVNPTSGGAADLVNITGAYPDQPAATATHVYWIEVTGNLGAYSSSVLKRANLDGTGVATVASNLCQAGSANKVLPWTLVTNGSHLYFACASLWPSLGTTYLAQVALDGSSVNNTFIDVTAYVPQRVTATATHAYIAQGGGGLVRVPLQAGATAQESLSTGNFEVKGIATDSTYVYWTVQQSIGRANLDLTGANAAWTSTAPTSAYRLQRVGDHLFFNDPSVIGTIGRVGVDGTGLSASFVSLGATNVAGLAASSGGGTAPAPASTAPVAGSTPEGPASLLRPITTKATKKATRQGATQVAAPVNLKDTGRYTFIFETRANSNERWTEMQVTSATRVVQQKNSRIGKKTLRRNSTAPVYTTTSANKKLVVVALIKKAQARNLRLRVIHRATNGTLTQDVFNA